jgi:DNA modification methylase
VAVLELLHGDCRAVMAGMPAASVDAVVCDPPYGLSFMGKDWDHGIPGVAFWSAALRVAKPGAHLLAFGGTRTFHRLAVAIEDAGWEIRDTVMWVYGSGFPKSHDVGKGIDKSDAGEMRTARDLRCTKWMRSTGLTAAQIDRLTNTNMGGHYVTAASQPSVPTREYFEMLRPHFACSVPDWVERMVDERTIESENFKKRAAVTTRKAADLFEAEREVAASKTSGIANKDEGQRHTIGASKSVEVAITAPATDAARQWDGWGTALKPAWEPIIVARKPLEGTVAANVLAHGTGALNIDGCRVGTSDSLNGGAYADAGTVRDDGWGMHRGGAGEYKQPSGRWPANLIHDGSDEVLAGFPDGGGGHWHNKRGENAVYSGKTSGGDAVERNGDTGSAARFFYCAKASKADRDEGCEGMQVRQTTGGGGMNDPNGDDVCGKYGSVKAPARNHHPTVKPTAIMRYLCKLVTPPNGTVLDPFMGSGSTGKAARMEGFGFIGIEQDAEYIDIARARIAHAVQSPAQQSLHI